MNLFRVDPETRTSRFGPLLGGDDDITLGVRPERFHLGDGALHSSEIWRVDGRVVLIEPTGRERIVHIQSSTSESFAILLSSDQVPAVGEHVTAWCERSHVHVYSNVTEQRLGNAQERGIDIREPALAHS